MYPWIILIATSSTLKMLTKISKQPQVYANSGIPELIRLKIKCPAVKFAINRIAKVKGRIKKLISSTITIKWINRKGVL